MFRKKGPLILCGTFLLITWNAILLFLLWGRPMPAQLDKAVQDQADVAVHPSPDVMGDVLDMANSIAAELEMQKKILLQIKSHKSLWKPSNKSKPRAVVPTQPVIPILVIACNRVTVRRCLDKLLEYRPSEELHPIIVSQDCGHAETAEVIRSYGKQVTHLQQPDLSDIAVKPQHKKFQGYYKISRHYHWALNQVFRTLSHSTVVIVEDDLEVIICECLFIKYRSTSRNTHVGLWKNDCAKCLFFINLTTFMLACCRWHQTSLSTSEPRCRC